MDVMDEMDNMDEMDQRENAFLFFPIPPMAFK